jgi:hypothetical protein
MKTINICLITKDPEYSMALSRSLQQYSKAFSLEIGSIQQGGLVGKLRQQQGKKTYEINDYDILLTDDMDASAERAVYLATDPASSWSDEESKIFIIYKYQYVGSISNIIRLAHSAYSNTEMCSNETEKTNIISICGSNGGSGCTTIALGVCQELARFNRKKVLYLCMEEFESTSAYFSEAKPKANNITRYLYSMLHTSEASSRTPEGYVVSDEYGVSTFIPAKGRNPLRDLTCREFVLFINQITKNGIYSDLVLDCGNGLDDSIVSAFQLSTWICHVIGKSTDVSRGELYRMTVGNRCEMKDFTKWLDVYNLWKDSGEEETESLRGSTKEKLIIPEDPSSVYFENGRRHITIDKVFGQGIHALTARLIRPI